MGIYDTISKYGSLENIDINQLILKGIISIAIIIFGIFLGKIVTVGLKKVSQKLELDKKIRGSFIDLFLVIIRFWLWAIMM